jgi:hypothetical protein
MEKDSTTTSTSKLLQQYLLLDSDERPSSLVECMDVNGQLCSEKYLQYSARESEADDVLLRLTLHLVSKRNVKEAIEKKQ